MASNLTYFTCTLGEANQDGIERPYRDVNSLIKSQAESVPDAPAIGFYVEVKHDSHKFETCVLSFSEVQQCVSYVTAQLSSTLTEYSTNRFDTTIGLLMSSSPEFLFTWLALVQLGHPILLLAPQCSDSAIAHLCSTCDVPILIVDDAHYKLGADSCNVLREKYGPAELRLSALHVPWLEILKLAQKAARYDQTTHQPDAVAYLHHTSGTSSGLPKPIPQTHHGAVGVLPALGGAKSATFTTTPLYHGGPADIFRAWVSSAMIWLFPSKDVPVTAQNVVKCLEAAHDCEKSNDCPVRYFTSVPYILQLMAADPEGLRWLQRMDMVGVGGAALPTKVGDRLVQQDVNLVSRFGSAECGFLLSSHRDYKTDKYWQYLRHSPQSTQIRFEERGNLFELIVGADWPHMAKRNRDDGSFATADLFEKHPTIDHAWRYHSRADGQITLSTGKKFDPAPLEHDIVASSDDIGDVLIFGSGRAYAGVLVFGSQNASGISDEVFAADVEKVMAEINAQSPPHARISPEMVVIMPYDDQTLEKSSKGTIMRNKAEARYQSHIDKAYEVGPRSLSKNVPDDQLEDAVRELVERTIGTKISPDDDNLFDNGVDSAACIQIRKALIELLPQGSPGLPLTIVEDSATIPSLAKAIKSLRAGHDTDNRDSRGEMDNLVQQFASLTARRPEDTVNCVNTSQRAGGRVVLLTGATGFLGSHILAQLLQDKNIAHVYILVRGATAHAAEERVLKALETRKLGVSELLESKTTILQCQLSEVNLGLDRTFFNKLKTEVDLIMHLAWSVNFLIATQSFKQHFRGLQNILDFSISSQHSQPPRLVFCSSVAAVSNISSTKNIPESIVQGTDAAGPTGYARSKLTAELILQKAATTSPALHNRITIIRVGQLSADTRHGIWNSSEAYPQILGTAKLTQGVVPDLGKEEALAWLPVDVAAKSFIEASLAEPMDIDNWPTEHVRHELGIPYSGTVGGSGIVKVLHLINPEIAPTFTEFLRTISKILADQGQDNLKIVSAREWLQSLSQIDGSEEDQNLLRLLPFWKKVYADRKMIDEDDLEKNATEHGFDMHKSLLSMPALAHWLGLSTSEGRRSGPNQSQLLAEDYVRKIWDFVQLNVP